MEFLFANLTNEEASKYFDLVLRIMQENFPELRNKYEAIKIVLFRSDSKLADTVEEEVNDFMGEKCVSLNEAMPSLRTTTAPPKACLQINLFAFEKYEIWKQVFSVRHECGHMLTKGDESKTISHLISKYGIDKLKGFVRYQHEFEVHLLMITKWQDDWLKEPVGFPESMPNPSSIVVELGKSKGRKETGFFCAHSPSWQSQFLCIT